MCIGNGNRFGPVGETADNKDEEEEDGIHALRSEMDVVVSSARVVGAGVIGHGMVHASMSPLSPLSPSREMRRTTGHSHGHGHGTS